MFILNCTHVAIMILDSTNRRNNLTIKSLTSIKYDSALKLRSSTDICQHFDLPQTNFTAMCSSSAFKLLQLASFFIVKVVVFHVVSSMEWTWLK